MALPPTNSASDEIAVRHELPADARVHEEQRRQRREEREDDRDPAESRNGANVHLPGGLRLVEPAERAPPGCGPAA